MRKKRKVKKQGWMFLSLMFLGLVFLAGMPVKAKAAGFQTIGGKTYYIKDDGEKHKGWLTLDGKKYFFHKRTGVQKKGWQKNSKGQLIRYFTSGKGVMVTGFLKDSKGRTRYFHPDTGYMAKGWMNGADGKYYFNKKTGVMYTGWVKTSKTKRYFDPATGVMATGWRTLDGVNYYFGSKGLMYINRTALIDGKTYRFSETGAASSEGGGDGSGDGENTENDKIMTVFDEKNGKNYTVMKEYAIHPGVQDGTTSDLDLLAAVCEAEAGDQGSYGMQAVALSILNRTIDENKYFPSSVRMVLYQGTSFPQYSVVTSGTLLKRLNGGFENKKKAYAAAEAAMKIFNDYVTNGTKRKIKGFKTKDFNYKYFMMESSYLIMPLDFDKVESYKYKDHVFFVDWVSPKGWLMKTGAAAAAVYGGSVDGDPCSALSCKSVWKNP